jgi:hypothetical protein
MEDIKDFFSEPKFSIVPDKNTNKTVTVKDEINRACLKITLRTEMLEVNNLDKCKNISGTDILKNIIRYAKHKRVPKICLFDESNVMVCDGDIKIPLSSLKILSTGESWYNSFGFKSDYYEEEIKQNREFISKKFKDVVDIGDVIYYQVLEKIIGKNSEEIAEKSVQQIFQKIALYLKTKYSVCDYYDEEDIGIIKDLILDLRHRLLYDPFLCINLAEEGVGRRGGSTLRRRRRQQRQQRQSRKFYRKKTLI